VIYDVVDPEANIIVGAVVDDQLEGEIHVTVIATGFDGGVSIPARPRLTTALESNGAALLDGAVTDDSGVRIPSFLLNRQNRTNND